MSTQNQAKLLFSISILILVIVCQNFAHSKPAPVRKPPFNGSIFGKRSSGLAAIPEQPTQPATASLSALLLTSPSLTAAQQQQQQLDSKFNWRNKQNAKNVMSILLKHHHQQQKDQEQQQQQQEEAAVRSLVSRCFAQDEMISDLETLNYCDELLALLNYEPAFPTRREQQLFDLDTLLSSS